MVTRRVSTRSQRDLENASSCGQEGHLYGLPSPRHLHGTLRLHETEGRTEAAMNEHVGRIVAWVKYDGDEYHNFIYQTHEPGPKEVQRMKGEGWLPLVVASDIQESDS